MAEEVSGSTLQAADIWTLLDSSYKIQKLTKDYLVPVVTKTAERNKNMSEAWQGENASAMSYRITLLLKDLELTFDRMIALGAKIAKIAEEEQAKDDAAKKVAQSVKEIPKANWNI